LHQFVYLLGFYGSVAFASLLRFEK
jgi:hypothetical protein